MIREQIANILWQSIGATNHHLLIDDIAGGILALPSGLEAVKKCECGNGYLWDTLSMQYVFHNACHGTGEIVRDLTVGEAIEWAKDAAIYLQSIPEWDDSERVRVKKEAIST